MEPETQDSWQQDEGCTEDGEKDTSAPDILSRTVGMSQKSVRRAGLKGLPSKSSRSGVAVNGGATSQSHTAGDESFISGSIRSSPIPTDPEQSFMEEETSAAAEDPESEFAAEADSLRHTEPNLGAEAPPGSWAENLSDVEEALDNVEFPEAVILVGKTHWRCVTCMTYYSQSTSIDQHIHAYHKEQDCTAKRGHVRGVSRPVGRPPGRTSTPGRASIKAASPGKGLRRDRPARNLQAELMTGRTLRKTHVEMGKSNVYRPTVRGRKGRGTRGGRGRGGRGRGGRGRGRGLFSQKLDDSDTEPEYVPTVQPKSLPARKRKARRSLEMHSNQSGAAPTAKILKLSGSADAPTEQALLETPSHVPHDNAKESFREKYMMVVERAGTSSHLSELEAAVTDVDHTIPIEIPSLQADVLLPPATPVLPEIHGLPETPLLPETPQHPDMYHPPETPAPLESAGTESLQNSGVSLVSESVIGDSQSTAGASKHSALQLSCRICHTVFESQMEVKAHLSEMSKFDIVLCSECGDKFHGLHELNMHVFKSHEKSVKKFCFICGSDFKDSFELDEHLLEHTLEEVEVEKDINYSDFISHTCKVCGLEVDGKMSNLVNHYHITHDQFICTTCQECFTDMTAYQEHKLLHMSNSNENGEPVCFACPVSDCFQVCEDKEALRDHISWHEDQDMEEAVAVLPCTLCDSHFWNKMSLNRHMAEVHCVPNIKPFICELCDEEFGHSLELFRHNTVNHAGIGRYGCAYCNQRFAFRSSFRRHVASQHDVAATILRI